MVGTGPALGRRLEYRGAARTLQEGMRAALVIHRGAPAGCTQSATHMVASEHGAVASCHQLLPTQLSAPGAGSRVAAATALSPAAML